MASADRFALARRFAQGVLDQEDVSETFLKGLPSATDRYDVIYPVLNGPATVPRVIAQSHCNPSVLSSLPYCQCCRATCLSGL